MSDHIRPQVHEAKAYLHFRDNGLSPYWTLRNLIIKGLDGHAEIDTEIGGEPWTVSVTYSDSGIAPRESDAVEREVLRDWELHAEGPGTEEKVHYQIRARYDDMKDPDGDTVSLPWEGGEGLDVFCQPSNVELDRLVFVLRSAIDALADTAGMDVNARYLTNPRPSSKITTLEYYVRICRDHSRRLVDPDGILHRIMYLLSPMEGTEWVYKGDNEDIVGDRHALALPPGSVRELGPYSLGVRAKHYHPKHTRDEETEDDPLSSPKFGIAYHKSIDGRAARKWDNRDEIRREIEELLINMMEWTGIDTSPDPMVFIGDDHFTVEPSAVEIDHTTDPTPQLEADQETLLMRVLGELSPAAREVTKEVATDGGSPHYEEIADRTDYSISTIYRALDQVKGILESDNGAVKFTSQKIRQEIVGMVDRFQELTSNTADRVAELANVELRSRAGSAWEKWAAKYGAELIDFDQADRTGTIRFDTILSAIKSRPEPNVGRAVREGKEAWIKSGRSGAIFDRFRIEAGLVDNRDLAGVKALKFTH